MVSRRLMIFISTTRLQIVLGGSTLPGKNENMEIINHITHVQEQHIRAQHVSYPGSLFTEPQRVKRKVEITRGYFGTLI